jgi:L-rhamnose-H+ transport protein
VQFRLKSHRGMATGGLALALLGGVLSGLYATPMAWMASSWEWENIWLVYSVTGLIVIPWIFGAATVSDLGSVYNDAGAAVVVEVFSFGIAWGVGSVLFGLALDRVGQSLTFAIVLALASSLGSIIPLLAFNSSAAGTAEARMHDCGCVCTSACS